MSLTIQGPRLVELLREGVVRIERQEYVATASDGVDVALGNVGDETVIEKYLTDHPSPDTW